jgi:hypothetical protein
LRSISKKLGITLLDGADLRRISSSTKISYPDRLQEEEFFAKVTAVDKSRMNKSFQQLYTDTKFSLVENFGAGTLNRALDTLSYRETGRPVAFPDGPVAHR